VTALAISSKIKFGHDVEERMGIVSVTDKRNYTCTFLTHFDKFIKLLVFTEPVTYRRNIVLYRETYLES